MNSTFTTTDQIIRYQLMQELKKLNQHADTVIVPEFILPYGLTRADVAVFNGIMHGYELKSDRDTLDRLERQVYAYNLIFDNVTLVIGKKHIYDALHMVPNWWGITLAKITKQGKRLKLLEIRAAKKNPSQNIKSITSLLLKNEAINILNKQDDFQKTSSKKEYLCHRLVQLMDKNELKGMVKSAIIRRFSS